VGRARDRAAPAALGLLLLALGTAAAQPLPGETPLEDILQILEVDRSLVALDARGGGDTRERLGVGERVLSRSARGQVGVALTDRRILAVTASSAAWQEARYQLREGVAEAPLLGERVALVLTNRRVIGFDGGSGNLVEQRLGPRERVLARAVSGNVAVAVTRRRALGLSPFTGGFFEAPIHADEDVREVDATANVATVRTSRRLLTFRAPSGTWAERWLGLE
jgi:hypothetical protein